MTDPDAAAGGPERESRILAAKRGLQIDVLTLEAVSALAEQGIRALLIKGPTIASWVYEEGESRPYVDADLLVSPEDVGDAEQVLSRLGLERLGDERVTDAFMEPHAVMWGRQGDSGTVDLHWRIPGIAAEPEAAWTRLASETGEVTVAGRGVEALGKPARALHLALHALQHGRESGKSMGDLARGIERIDEDTWRSASELAGELCSTVPLAAGLRLTPDGALLADRLGLPKDVPVRWALWAQSPPHGALRLHEFAATPGIWAKARLLAAALVPSPAYMRGVYPSSRKGPGALTRAYLRRMASGIVRAPAAVRALRRAQAEGRRSA